MSQFKKLLNGLKILSKYEAKVLAVEICNDNVVINSMRDPLEMSDSDYDKLENNNWYVENDTWSFQL